MREKGCGQSEGPAPGQGSGQSSRTGVGGSRDKGRDVLGGAAPASGRCCGGDTQGYLILGRTWSPNTGAPGGTAAPHLQTKQGENSLALGTPLHKASDISEPAPLALGRSTHQGLPAQQGKEPCVSGHPLYKTPQTQIGVPHASVYLGTGDPKLSSEAPRAQGPQMQQRGAPGLMEPRAPRELCSPFPGECGGSSPPCSWSLSLLEPARPRAGRSRSGRRSGSKSETRSAARFISSKCAGAGRRLRACPPAGRT